MVPQTGGLVWAPPEDTSSTPKDLSGGTLFGRLSAETLIGEWGIERQRENDQKRVAYRSLPLWATGF